MTDAQWHSRLVGRWWSLAAGVLAAAVLPLGLPAQAAPGGYLVVTAALKPGNPQHQRFREVAAQVAAFHKAATVAFDGQNFDALQAALRERKPQNVLIVVPPEVLDVNFHRHVLLLSNTIDPDPFADFAFGYFTARDGAALEALWRRTETLHRKGLASKTWVEVAITSQGKSFSVPDNIPEPAKAVGFTGVEHYFASIEADPAVLTYAREKLKSLAEASVICLTGNGDPQGIWLFDGRRNLDRTKHWPFDPKKVGQDPNGEMPRITGAWFRELKLKAPIVWSGTCHSGATARVLVEGDIVSTFGRSEVVPLYVLKPEESLGLSLLDAGAGALLVPIGANHGMSVSREVAFALTHGASLGEAVKSTYDDVFLQCDGKLQLVFEVPGEPPHRGGERVMQGGGANRLLIGDPALRPFPATPDPKERIEIRKAGDDAVDVSVTLAKGFHAWDWDMYGTDRARDWRVYARIDLDGLLPPGKEMNLRVSVEVTDAAGEPIPHVVSGVAAEEYQGRRFLHLQANADRKEAADKERRAVFHVTGML